MKKPDLTDDDIRSHMNFDKLLHAYQQSGGPASQPSPWAIIGGSSVAILAVSIIAYFYFQNPETTVSKNPVPERIAPADSVGNVSDKNEKTVAQEKPKVKLQPEKIVPSKSVPVHKPEQKDTAAVDKKALSQFTEAAPVDGYPALYAYFDRELKYPTTVKDSAQGIVSVSFAINEKGKPDRIKIENSLGAPFDAECKRVIENMPLWNPATINGKPVTVRMSIPLTFKIKK